MTVFERVFRYFKFELPSTGLKSFEVTRETVINPVEALKNLLKESTHQQRTMLRSELQSFASRFKETHDLSLEFNDDACEVLIDLSVDKDKTIRSICEDLFKDFEHGLKIIARNTGQSAFTITGDMARNPDAELSKWVVNSFRNRKPEPEEPNA
ncbi:MAG: hypothetical protein LR015_02280 [Verrucomicrobia bacterium]|nr:hypothetical protein [Verrucomicrobiota bacterium]